VRGDLFRRHYAGVPIKSPVCVNVAASDSRVLGQAEVEDDGRI